MKTEIAVEKPFAALSAHLSDCPTRDRAAFARRLRDLRRRGRDGKPMNQGLEQLATEMDAAATRLRERRAALPVPIFDDSLPINARRAAEEPGLWERLAAGVRPPPDFDAAARGHLDLYAEELRRKRARAAAPRPRRKPETTAQ